MKGLRGNIIEYEENLKKSFFRVDKHYRRK